MVKIFRTELKNEMGPNFSENEGKTVFALGDTDQDGSISFLEFAKLITPSATDALAKFWKCFRDIKIVRQAFKQFDADNDGAITRQEVIQGMKVSDKTSTMMKLTPFSFWLTVMEMVRLISLSLLSS